MKELLVRCECEVLVWAEDADDARAAALELLNAEGDIISGKALSVEDWPGHCVVTYPA